MLIINNVVKHIILSLICITPILFKCSMGGSTEQGNARILGNIIHPLAPQNTTEIHLVPESFNPFDTGHIFTLSTSPDSLGYFCFENISSGLYYIYAFDKNKEFVILKGPYQINEGENYLENDTMKNSASIQILSRSTNLNESGFFIKGTTDKYWANDSMYTTLHGVPSGTHDLMAYHIKNKTTEVYTRNITINPNDTITVSYNNRPPQILTTPSQLGGVLSSNKTYQDTIFAIDPDSETVFFSIIDKPDSLYIDTLTGIFTWSPQPSDSITSLTFIVSDKRGLNSSIRWNFNIISDSSAAPTPSLSGNQNCLKDSSYQYSIGSIFCESASLYRFYFGIGDTSPWSNDTIVMHTWKNAGTFSVSAQAFCQNYSYPSSWSTPVNVQVNKNQITDIPVIYANSDDTIYLHDTIRLFTDSLYCKSSLYKFYINDVEYSDWSTLPFLSLSPSAEGSYSITVSRWCDTANNYPSAKSAPWNFYVINKFQLLPPQIQKTYCDLAIDTLMCYYNILPDSNFNIEKINYIIGFQDIDSSFMSTFGYIKIKDNDSVGYNDLPSFTLSAKSENDTLICKWRSRILVCLYNPKIVFTIKIRAKYDDLISDWTYITIKKED
ncbi:MAG TPA: hypothetical protein VHO70_19770 [Chitinispirillaceae bacterium]|nr:hypothetical protein [Chitinispirillaceae bacterium]